jgi:hypothetical protein
LGPNLPAEEVVAFCRTQQVRLLCVSVIRKPQPAALAGYLKEIGELALTGTRVVIGGRQLSQVEFKAQPGVEIAFNWEDFDSSKVPRY